MKKTVKASAKPWPEFPVKGSIETLGFSPDGRKLAIGQDIRGPKDKLHWRVAVYSTATAKELWGIDCVPHVHAFSPDSRNIAVLKKGINVFSIKTGKQPVSIRAHFDSVRSFCFSPDGKLIAAAGDYETEEYSDNDTPSIGVWNAKTGKPLWEERCGIFHKVCFNPDGTEVYAAEEGTANRHTTSDVAIFDTATGDRRHRRSKWSEFHVRGLRIYNFDVSADGKKIIVGGDINDPGKPCPVFIWNAATAEATKRLDGHTRAVGTVAFSPDGRLAATGSWDNTTRIWNVRSGRNLHTFDHGSRSVAFTPDSTVLVAGWGSLLNIYDVKSGKSLSSSS